MGRWGDVDVGNVLTRSCLARSKWRSKRSLDSARRLRSLTLTLFAATLGGQKLSSRRYGGGAAPEQEGIPKGSFEGIALIHETLKVRKLAQTAQRKGDVVVRHDAALHLDVAPPFVHGDDVSRRFRVELPKELAQILGPECRVAHSR